jgi:hypothetical protein
LVKATGQASELPTPAVFAAEAGHRRRAASMSITVLCPNLSCKTVLHVPEKMRGQMIRCGKCGTYLMVPRARTCPPATGGGQPAQSPQEALESEDGG